MGIRTTKLQDKCSLAMNTWMLTDAGCSIAWTLVDSGADANFVSHTWASKCLSKTEGKPKVTQAVEQESAFVEQAIPGSNATISIQVRSQKDGKKRKPM